MIRLFVDAIGLSALGHCRARGRSYRDRNGQSTLSLVAFKNPEIAALFSFHRIPDIWID
jgi:hypothetical protein